MEYSWPGNIRELINAVERAVILAQDEEVQPEDLALRLGIGPSGKKTHVTDCSKRKLPTVRMAVSRAQ